MRRFSLLLGVVLLCVQLVAQQRTITGRVTDDKGEPVANASVTVKGTTIGTTTKNDGTYSIGAPAGAKTLVISSIGMASEEILIGGRASIITSLKASDKTLEEVVVSTGYTREKKSQFIGAASVISGKLIETVPVGSFDQALQGRAPGVLVNSSSGQPGSSATVTIRGVQSIQGAGAQPLYVLDGIPITAGEFQTLNADDFESFTVLKDAGAAALYGARAGTGVIVITSKKGKAGPTSFAFRNQVGVTQAPSFARLNTMNTAEMFEYERRLGVAGLNPNSPGWVYNKTNPAYAALTPATQARYDFLYDSIGKINTNYADFFYRQGLSQTHEVNVTGGSEKTKFFLSAGYFNQQGIDRGSALKRYTTRFNVEHTANKFTVLWNTAVGYSINNYSEGEALGNSARNPFQMTYRAKTYENPYRADGSIIYGTNTTLALKQVGNLLEGIQNSSLEQKQIKITSGITLAYKILPSLTIKNTFGLDVSTNLWQRYIVPGSYIGSLQTFGNLYPGLDIESYRVSTNLINTSSLVYAKRFNKHEVEAGAYFEVIRNYQKGLGFTLYNLDPRLLYTGQGAGSLPTTPTGSLTYPQYATSASSGYGIRSYFATARYTYNNRYTISGNIRRDGTSRIANDANKEITTWAAGFSWNAMQEDFMKTQGILTDLRVRASYGIVPNIGSISTSSYALLGTAAGTWVSVDNFLGPQVPGYGTTSYTGGSSITGIVPSSPGNPNLKIENIQKTNIGVDFAVWHNRARFSVDVYKNRTVDLFVNQPLSGTTGFGSLNINAGVMSNKGVELTAAVDVVRTRDWGVTLGWNHAINKNTIDDLGLVDEYFAGTFVIRKGLPYGSHYTYHYLGADPATGKPRFETADGKETLDAAQAGQFAKFGTYLPKHEGGFNLGFRYKGFTVDAFFSYQFDVVRSNNIRNWITRGTIGYQGSVNGSRELLTNQWQKPGDQAFFQSPIYDRGFTSSDLENAKFLRFRNLNVAYQLPPIKFTPNTILKGVRLYVQFQNLYVWSKWTGLDPEDGNNISLNEYPNPKMVVGGLDINF